jgi:hypothetical protein
MAYGVRDEDGVSFRKGPDLWDSFKNSDAYSELFVELLSNPHATGQFFAGLVPKDFQAGVQEAMKKSTANVVDVTNVFDQANPALPEPTSEPTHEVPQPEDPALTGAVDRGVSMKDRIAGLSDDEKDALRAELGI